jgi:rod shape-determining protein MreD
VPINAIKQVPLLYSFSLALFAALFGTVFFPNIRLMAFAPFLAIVYNRRSFVFSLWIASLCGLILDLSSSQMRFGFFALCYALMTLLIYKQKRHFFEDKPLALACFAALISFATTGVQLFLQCAFESQVQLSWSLFLSDLIAMPIADAIYAFLWFTLPIRGYQYLKRVGWKEILAKSIAYLNRT